MKPKFEVVASVKLDSGEFDLRKTNDGQYYIYRKGTRGGVPNKIAQYTDLAADGNSTIRPIDEAVGRLILNRIQAGEHFSSAFLFADSATGTTAEFVTSLLKKSDMDERFTSTGAKFWKHPDELRNFKSGKGATVISTHISPEGRCNLACPYCSVTYRQNKSRLDFDLILDYVDKLRSRGLKAVILTGGGEPTLYPQINQLLEELFKRNLSVALITNGTNLHKLDWALVSRLTWMRMSVNIFEGWEEKIRLPQALPESVTLGLSFIYTPQHESDATNLLDVLSKVKLLADRVSARYIRLLPNCLLDQSNLLKEHFALSKLIAQLNDSRFFHQGKIHEAPESDVCHQSYFRPYLSEEPYPGTNIPGTVFPCDSIVLNQDLEHFNEKFALCQPGDILQYMDHMIQAKFNPRKDCTGCVFTGTVNMLENYKVNGIERFDEFSQRAIDHVDFV